MFCFYWRCQHGLYRCRFRSLHINLLLLEVPQVFTTGSSLSFLLQTAPSITAWSFSLAVCWVNFQSTCCSSFKQQITSVLTPTGPKRSNHTPDLIRNQSEGILTHSWCFSLCLLFTGGCDLLFPIVPLKDSCRFREGSSSAWWWPWRLSFLFSMCFVTPSTLTVKLRFVFRSCCRVWFYWTVLHYAFFSGLIQENPGHQNANMFFVSSYHVCYLPRVSRVLQLQFYSSVHAGRLNQPSSPFSPENHIFRLWIQFDEIRSNSLIPEREIMMKHQWRLWENWEQLIKTSSLDPGIWIKTGIRCRRLRKRLWLHKGRFPLTMDEGDFE